MEFIDILPEIQKSMGILHHNVTTHNIKWMGEKAEGETYIIAFHQVLLIQEILMSNRRKIF